MNYAIVVNTLQKDPESRGIARGREIGIEIAIRRGMDLYR